MDEHDEDTADRYHLLVEESDAGKRADRFVVERLTGLGRRGAARLFAAGAVRSGRRRVAKGDVLLAGQQLEVHWSGTASAEPDSNAALEVVLDRPDLLVVDKPPGQPCVALRGGEPGVLAGALLGHDPRLAEVGERGAAEAGLVHRLDNWTSGLLLVARHSAVLAHLRSALSDGKLDKRYLALVAEPVAEEGRVELELETDPSDRRRVKPVGPSGGTTSEYRKLRSVGGRALLEVSAPRAVRHQVRAHLAAIGSPLLGDELYGGARPPELPAPRHALHASYLAWAGDGTVAAFALESPLPADLARLLAG